MGLLNLFAKPRPVLQRLPSGSLTVDRDGNIVTTTVSSSYPEDILQEVADEVLRLFVEVRKSHLPLHDLKIQFASLHITAREARGGAIIFLSPAGPL